jgi:translation initiation factor 2 subunit 1
MSEKYPEPGDLVILSVEEVKGFGAKGKLVEYPGMDGFVHIAEIATGWVKHIRDYIKEGQKTVCKVLSVDKSRNHAELSLKRVNQHQKREKISEWKNEQKALKLLEIVSQNIGKTVDECNALFADDLRKRYGSLYDAFEDAAMTERWLPDVNGSWKEPFVAVAKNNIQVSRVKIGGKLEAYCLASDGIKRIVSAIDSDDEKDVEVQYAGSPNYRVTVTGENYKEAEEVLKKYVDHVMAESKKLNVYVEFTRY